MSKPNGRFFFQNLWPFQKTSTLTLVLYGLQYFVLKKENIYGIETTLSKKYDTAAVYFAAENFAPFFMPKR